MNCKCDIHQRLAKKVANWIINEGLYLCHKHKISTVELKNRIPPLVLKITMIRTMSVEDQLHLIMDLI